MLHYRFILDEEVTPEQEDNLIARFDSDVLIGVFCGVPYLDFERDDRSLDEAIRQSLLATKLLGVSVKRVETEPEMYLQSTPPPEGLPEMSN